MALPPTNFEMLQPSRRPVLPGDVFTVRMAGGPHLFGRVVRTDAHCFAPGCILIYVFRSTADEPAPPERLLVRDLLIPPQTINRLGWSRGYLMTIGHRPFGEGEVLSRHYFKQLGRGRFGRSTIRFVDEDGQPLGRPPRGALVGWAGLGNYRTLDDAISEALGLPLAPDP